MHRLFQNGDWAGGHFTQITLSMPGAIINFHVLCQPYIMNQYDYVLQTTILRLAE